MKRFLLFIKDLIITVVLGVAIAYLLMTFVLTSVVVSGSSMYPTLHDGDYGFSFILTKNLKVERFDIVVVKHEEDLIVKRIIGMPGETIKYSDNKLYVNGEYVEEDFLDENTKTNDFEYTLGEGEYYVLGDNRSSSKDSRAYGTFTIDDFVSSNVFVIWPFTHFGLK